jgi:hypothetical protein
MKIEKIIYWIATAGFCGIMLFSASMYFSKYEMVKGFFQFLGYPQYLIYPLAIAKIIGVIVILTKKVPLLKEWVYAGFLFDSILAFTAHIVAKDAGYTMALAAMILIIISRFFESKIYKIK